MRSRVSRIRDALIGRRKARLALGLIEERDEDEIVVISKTPPKSVIAALKERFDVPLELVEGGGEADPEGRATYACTDPVGLRTAFKALVTEGFFLARGTPRVKEEVGVDERFIDLSLTAK